MPKRPVTGTLKENAKNSHETKARARKELTPRQRENLTLKAEAARELGLWEKVRTEGWGALTAAESGAVGGYMTRVRLAARRQDDETPHNSS